MNCFDTKAQAASALAEQIAAALNSRIAKSPMAHLYVSGGRSPVALFRALSTAQLDWARVCVHLVDERVVAPNSEFSNARLVRENLLINQAAAAKFIPLVDANAQALKFSPPPAADALVLGMGADGHFASIFPAAANLAELLDTSAKAAYVFVQNHDFWRISLNLAAILQAKKIFLSINGAEKLEVLSDKNAPISAVKSRCEVYYSKEEKC